MPLPHPLDHAVATFGGLRPRLFGIAYRMLGSAAEAEDVVQEAWLRWQGTDRSLVRDPGSFLATTTTRLALNVAQSARSRRETYVGQWLPEPVDTRDDPALGAERSEALEVAVLLLLEKLRPKERAVFVLAEAFDYSYAEIAEMLQLTEPNARQLASRARRFLGGERRRAVSAEEHRRLLDAFLTAARAGDRAGLEQILASDAVSHSDGGGLAVATPRPIAGQARVAKFVVGILRKTWSGAVLDRVEANGRAAVLVSREVESSGS
jgi:RNA polymerase sigma-70 factor (ECF subfamily)